MTRELVVGSIPAGASGSSFCQTEPLLLIGEESETCVRTLKFVLLVAQLGLFYEYNRSVGMKAVGILQVRLRYVPLTGEVL